MKIQGICTKENREICEIFNEMKEINRRLEVELRQRRQQVEQLEKAWRSWANWYKEGCAEIHGLNAEIHRLKQKYEGGTAQQRYKKIAQSQPPATNAP